jgi:DNA-directed RNA polymerase N-terminal
MNLFQR